MLQFSVLASGSRANCVFVASDRCRVLVDCGLSARQTEVRLAEFGICPKTIGALVISHEHSDHIAGVRVFATRHGTEVYVTRDTYDACSELQLICPTQLRFFESGVPFMYADLEFDSFNVVHDAADPVGFRIRSQERVLGIVTDLGHVTELVRERARDLDAIVLESNHDPLLLEECSYPWQLKQRISGSSGHLSNQSAGTLLAELAIQKCRLQLAVAAHISENSNRPELAVDTLHASWRGATSETAPKIIAAGPAKPTDLFRL